jgi:hypothetical protein
MLKKLGRSGGPEEDRTPDLLIANDTTVRNINDLRRRSSAVNSPITGGECTNRAQRDYRRPFHVAPQFAATHIGPAAYSRPAGKTTRRGPG